MVLWCHYPSSSPPPNMLVQVLFGLMNGWMGGRIIIFPTPSQFVIKSAADSYRAGSSSWVELNACTPLIMLCVGCAVYLFIDISNRHLPFNIFTDPPTHS